MTGQSSFELCICIFSRYYVFFNFYSINEQDLFLPSFHAQYGYKNRYCATDIVYICEAALQSVVSIIQLLSSGYVGMANYCLRQNITTQGVATGGNVLPQAVIRHTNMPTGQ